MIDTTDLYSLMHVWMTQTFILSQFLYLLLLKCSPFSFCVRKQILLRYFLQNFLIHLGGIKFSVMTHCLLKLILKWFWTINIQKKRTYSHDYIKHILNIGLHSGRLFMYHQTSIKLGMMISITKLYSLMPIWMALSTIQGHLVTRKLEPVLSS